MDLFKLKTKFPIPTEKEVVFFLQRFYLIGAVGFIFPPLRPLFVKLIPFALLLSLILVIWYELHGRPVRPARNLVVFLLLVYFSSYLVEMVGVNTGFIFGTYTYGQSLGLKLFNTPLLIGVNWTLLVLGSASLSQGISRFLGFEGTRYVDSLFRIILGSVLMLMADLVLEQIADLLQMWDWAEVLVPAQNYLAWFLLSFLFQLFYVITGIQLRTNLAAVLFFFQIIFFLAVWFGSFVIS